MGVTGRRARQDFSEGVVEDVDLIKQYTYFSLCPLLHPDKNFERIFIH